MPLQITPNAHPTANLRISANQRARMSSVLAIDWDHVTDVPAIIDAIGDLGATTGLLAQTGSLTFAKRTITGTADKITVTNGDGVSGNPTITIPEPVKLMLRVDPATADGDNYFGGDNVGNATLSPGGGAATLASGNIGVGKDVLYSLTIGYGNIGIGQSNMGAATTAALNVAVGNNALGSLTTGPGNVAYGQSAAYKTTTGQHNTAIGLQAFHENTTGSHNTYAGRDAGFSNTTGSWNTGFGVDANPGNTTGTGNTAVGGEAGYTQTPANQNVTGINNVWVGYQSGPSSTSQYNNTICIGYRAQSSASNQIVLGDSNITETLLRGTVRNVAGYGMLGGSYNLVLKNIGADTAERTLTFGVFDGNRVVRWAGDFVTFGAISLPPIVQGDIWYGSAAGVMSALAKSASASQFLKNSGTSNNPAWAQPAFTDISGSVAAAQMPALTGDITTSAGAVATTLATVNSNVGTFGSATQVAQVTVNAKGLTTAASNVTVTPAVGSITGLGTGVATALAVNVGTAGSPVVNGGALGSPSSAGTIPAFTLGGTISGGGNQINNVVIGTSTPLAGAFTTVSASGLISADGGQIKFPSTQNASADVNTLDDYEEGTFTPTITFGGGSTGITYTTQTGKYTKIGNVVTYVVFINLSSKGSSAGSAVVQTLPFVVGESGIAVCRMNNGAASATTAVHGNAVVATASFNMERFTAGASTIMADTDFNNNTNIRMNGIYYI